MHLGLEQEVLEAVKHPLTENNCFVCGCALDKSNRTREHVLPQWLQQQFNLAHDHLVLLNGTPIPYRQITVPCCRHCNGTHLSQLERSISMAVGGGYPAVREVPESLLYQWLAKIYVGLLYKELLLPADRVDPEKGSIVRPEELRDVRVLWFWLRQSLVRQPQRKSPGSIWTFRCLVPPQGHSKPFDLHDFHRPSTFGIRMGEVGLIVDFLDCGLLKQRMAQIELDLKRLRLSPEQFIEVFARFSYKASTFGLHTSVSVVRAEDGEQVVKFSPESTVPGDDHFWPWDESRYAELLAFHTGLQLQDVLLPNGKARSWLYDEAGKQLRQYKYR